MNSKSSDTILKLATDCQASYAAWQKLQAAMLDAAVVAAQ